MTWVYLLIFAVAFLASFSLTPLVVRLAARLNIVDRPRTGKIHTRPVPRLGGLAVFAGFLAATAVAFVLGRGKALGEYDLHYLGLIIGSLVIVGLGIYDDKRGAKAPVKFVFQIIAAVALLACGYAVKVFTNPFGGQISLGFWRYPLLILWIVGVTNALNLIDGLDGLACGVTGIAGLTLFFASYQQTPFVPIVAIALVGACAGFLPHNFYPARIFLGDTGSLFLGFVLAALSIQGSFKTTAGMALVLPLVALLVPIADTVGVFVRRLITGQHPFQADQRHVHHKLLSLGYSQTQTVLMIYIMQINLGIIALVLKSATRTLAIGMLLLMGLMLFIFFCVMAKFRLSVEKMEENNKKLNNEIRMTNDEEMTKFE